MQVEQDKEQLGQREVDESDAYSLFLYAMRSPVTRDYYLRRLRIFLNHISLFPKGTMEERCNLTEKYPKGSRVCIVTGSRIDLAEDLISRFKGLFSKVSPRLFDKSSSTTAILNGVRIEAFPSHHVDTMRGLTNVKFILSDESDYYPPFQQKECRAVMEGYIGKPNSIWKFLC